MTTPRTEAGRFLLRNMLDVERVYNLPAVGVDSRIRAIEDEAARMERERIDLDVDRLAAARHRWMHPTFPTYSRCDCIGFAERLREADELVRSERAAITDTGEEAAP